MSTTPTPAPTTAEPQKITWDAPDGKHYEGSHEELFKIASERYNNLYPEYSNIKTEAQQLREQRELIQQATHGTEPAPDQFNKDKYWTLMQQNPLEAQQYANQYDPAYQRAIGDLQTTRQNQEASIFKSENPDFKADEANVEKLARTCQTLFPETKVYDAQQMTAAYTFMSRQTAKPPDGPPVPPAPPATSVTQPSGNVDYTKLSQVELANYIRDLESKGYR